jgi:intracellular septation protein
MERAPGTGPVKLEGREKTLVELGPMGFFLAGYFLSGRTGPLLDGLFGSDLFSSDGGQLYTGLALFLPAFVVAFVFSVIRTRRVAPMLGVTGAIVIILGALTFIFQDKTFFYIKPTIVYGLTAAVLGGGLLTGQNFLKVLFDGALEMSEAAWKTLTLRFVGFNALAAIANEIAWRTLTAECVPDADCPGEAVWVNLKLFGFTIAYFVFVAANAPLIMKHARSEG